MSKPVSRTIRVDEDVAAALKAMQQKTGGSLNKVLHGLLTAPNTQRPRPTGELSIKLYWHCKLCLMQRPENMAPSEWQRISVGLTDIGMQVWCERHHTNIAHVDYEGQIHPANLSAQ